MFRDSEFMREVDEECQRMRGAERDAARHGEPISLAAADTIQAMRTLGPCVRQAEED